MTRAPRLYDRIVRQAAALFPELQRRRRDFHQHPELSNQEERTGRVAAAYLTGLGLEVTTGVAGHGVVADLICPRPGPTIAYRADMDALPITEPPDQPWCSQNPGVMHACGHDFHLAIALGAAKLLSELRPSLAGRFRFILQPAEEGLPAGTVGGAELMVQQGVLTEVAAIVGLHVAPMLAVGQLGHCPDIVMAGADQLRLEILGRQAHAATPHHGVDAIVIAAQALTLLQAVLAQGKDARAPAVLTFGTIAGGSRFNILADQVVLEGTLRYHDPKVRTSLLEQAHRLLEGVTAGRSARYRLESQSLYPILMNDPDLTGQALEILQPFFGPHGLVQMRPVLGSEDFAFYAQKVPGFYFFLGTRSPGADRQTLHSPDFDPDEAALTVGLTAAAGLLVGLSAQAAA
jgi:amidohydrolase